MHLLLASANREEAQLLSHMLGQCGLAVHTARDIDDVRRQWRGNRPNLVLLDLSGREDASLKLCREMHDKAGTPIIVLHDNGSEGDADRAKEAGANAYIVKPYNLTQLAVRAQALLKPDMMTPSLPRSLDVEGLILDIESHEIRYGGRKARLTPTEFRLLYALAINPRQVVGSERLINIGWGALPADQTFLKSHISRVRTKLKQVGLDPGILRGVRWVGYSLELGEDARATAAV
jgi:DNA-binding response OmpR family regulator